MYAPIPSDGTSANDTTLSFSSRSELAYQLLLLAQGQELLPKETEAPVISQVLDLPFVDDVERQLFCHDLRLLVSLKVYPLVNLVDQLPLCLALLRRYSPIQSLQVPLLTLAVKSNSGLSFFPLIQAFIKHSQQIPTLPSSWKVILQLLLYRRSPEQLAKLTFSKGLDVLPRGVHLEMQELLLSQVRTLACFLSFRDTFKPSVWSLLIYIIKQIRFHHTFAFTIAQQLSKFVKIWLPKIEVRLEQIAANISLPKKDEHVHQRLFHLFCFYLLHSHPRSLKAIEDSLPNLSYFFDEQLDFTSFRQLGFEKVIQYLPPYFLWHKSLVLFQHLPIAIHLAVGKNIRTYPLLLQRITKKMAHQFSLLSEQDFQFNNSFSHICTLAYWRAIIPQQYHMLLPYLEGYIRLAWITIDTHDVTNAQYTFGRWDTFLQKLFSLPLPILVTRDQMNQLLGYYTHLIDEQIEWSLKGITWNAMNRRAANWYQARRPTHKDLKLAKKWKRKDYPGFEWEPSSEVKYTISELTTAEALQQESRKMRHCVESYQSRCISGQSAIWSLSIWEKGKSKSLLTIEVNRQMRIVQMRGVCNRRANKIERNIVKRWANKAGLKILKGV
mgnify:CR=1 FL=1